MGQRLLSTREAAAYLGVGLSTFRVIAKRLPAIRPGLRWRYYRQADLDLVSEYLSESPSVEHPPRRKSGKGFWD